MLPLEDDLSPVPPLEDDEAAKLEPGETIAERVKLNPPKRKTTGTGLKILTPNKLLARLPILLGKIKARNNSCKLKSKIRQMLYLSYRHNKITKEVYKNSIRPL